MIMHSKHCDVQVKLLNVAYVPGVQLNLFSLHAAMPKCSVSLDVERVHMLDENCLSRVGTLALT